MKLVDLHEAAAEKLVPVYISLDGEWDDGDYNSIHKRGTYTIKLPAEVAKKVVDALDKMDEEGDEGILGDDPIDFEDDFAPSKAEGHAHDITFGGVSLEKPKGNVNIKHNYKMVYHLRDMGLIDKDVAEKAANS